MTWSDVFKAIFFVWLDDDAHEKKEEVKKLQETAERLKYEAREREIQRVQRFEQEMRKVENYSLAEKKEHALKNRLYEYEGVSFWHEGKLYRYDHDGTRICNRTK